MRNNPSLSLALSLASWLMILLAGCTSTRPKETYGPGYEPPPAKEPQIQLPEPVTEAIPEAKKARPKVALVIGGAGLASFATVGLLKRLHEQGIEIDFIVASGGPALFSVGYGFMKSLHDLEWFAMNIPEKDLKALGSIETSKDLDSTNKTPKEVERAFQNKSLGETKLPIVISTVNSDLVEPEAFERGDWRQPLFATSSIPGVFRDFPKEGDEATTKHVKGIDQPEAERRGAELVVVVDMYGDYFAFQKTAKKTTDDKEFRDSYLSNLQSGVKESVGKAAVTGKILLHKPPTDLNKSARRAAIRAGYVECSRLAKEIRAIAGRGE